MKTIVPFLIAVSLPSGALAQDYTVQEMLPYCEAALAGHATFSSGLCMGLAAGVSAVAVANCGYFQRDPNLSFLPMADGGGSHGATVQSFVNWARAHPQFWSYPAAIGMLVSLGQTFPCQAE